MVDAHAGWKMYIASDPMTVMLVGDTAVHGRAGRQERVQLVHTGKGTAERRSSSIPR
jgi:hypothetical protein